MTAPTEKSVFDLWEFKPNLPDRMPTIPIKPADFPKNSVLTAYERMLLLWTREKMLEDAKKFNRSQQKTQKDA